MATLYISKALEADKYKSTRYGLATFESLSQFGDQLLQLDTANPWARDYMPVLNAKGEWVKFGYQPAYMQGIKKYESWHPKESFFDSLGIKYKKSKLIIDGGNVELLGETAIITDRFFRDNCKTPSDYKSKYNELKQVLEVNKLIVVPEYPYDVFGHIDGSLRLVSENKVLISNPVLEFLDIKNDKNKQRKKLLSNWINAFKSILLNHDLEIEYLPSFTDNYAKYPTSAVGNYLNFAHFGDKILMPSFKGFEAENEAAKRVLEKLYKKRVIPIETTNLARFGGGVINCVTWVK